MRNFELETYFSTWEFRARHHMTASDVESMTVDELLSVAGLEEASPLSSLKLSYTETWGAPALREALAATYEYVGAEDILCFAGAEEGVYVAMRVLLAADDHAIIVVPNYQAAETIPLDICEVSGVALNEQRHWQLDIDEVRAAIQPNTKLISVNFPNNPTGAIIGESDYRSLIEICRDKGIYLFNDEVYRLLELDERKRIPQVADLYEKGLSLNVMSKAYGLPGLRIGWIACRDHDVLVRMERYKHYLSICNSAPSEQLALIALGAGDRILQRNRALMRDNLAELEKFFGEYASLFEWSRPDGSCIAFPRYRGRDGVEAFCTRLVEQSGVLLLPASVYRSDLMPTPRDRFRIGFGRKNISEGLEAFRGFLKSDMAD